MSKIIFYGLQSENFSTENTKDFISLNCKINLILFDSENERKDYIDFLDGNCLSFDITDEIMEMFNLKTKQDVYNEIKKARQKQFEKVAKNIFGNKFINSV